MPELVAAAVRRDVTDMEHMRRLIAFAMPPQACCIDIGAHRGAILQEIVRVAPEGRHIAFEPLPNLAAQLAEDFPDVEVREVALSNRSGQTIFAHVHGVAEGCSGLLAVTAPDGYANEVEEITVRLETLDGSLDPGYEPDLIKLDVEGAERQVLEGALETIRRSRPIIVFEHAFAASNAYDTAPGDIYELLCNDLGLRIFDLDGSGPYDFKQFERCSHTGERVNYVARV